MLNDITNYLTAAESLQIGSLQEEIQYRVSAEDSIIYIDSDFADGTIVDFISRVRYILSSRSEESAKDPINIVINSNGGDVTELLGILDYIHYIKKNCDVDFNAICRGAASSAAAFLLALTTGKRYASKRSVIMVHQPQIQINLPRSSVSSYLKVANRIEDDIYAELSVKTKKSAQYWKEVCQTDHYMTASEALELGLIDEIL
jgi:ATP-dependent Clp endopeptidase proteolytic subunit ClpP